MTPIKPGPSLTISQRGKRLHRLHAFIVELYFAPRLGRMGMLGFIAVAAASVKAEEQCDPGCFADPMALTCLMSSLEWHGY